MGKTYLQQGDVITLTAPSGGVTAGAPIIIGTVLVIPCETAAEAAKFDAYVTGVHSVTKADSQAWTEGAKIYWDDTNKVFTTTSTSNSLRGVAVEAVASTAGLTTGKVRLNGQPV